MAKKVRQLSDDRKNAVISEIVDMYVENNGAMPSARQIKKSQYISEEEVSILRRNGELQEWRIRKIATEKTGREFKTEKERHQEASAMAAKARKQKEEAMEQRVEQVEQQIQVEQETEQKVEQKVEAPRRAHYADGEVETMLREACKEAGHVLTQAEVGKLAEAGRIPRWATLMRHVGPWYLWSEKFEVPFVDEKQARAAERQRAKASSEEVAVEETAEEIPKGALEEAPEEMSVTETPEEMSVTETPEEMIIPFKLIIPKGIHGTFSVQFSI